MIDPDEKAIHRAVIQHLMLMKAPGVKFWHTAQNRMSAKEGGYWRRMGVTAGVPDLVVVIPGKGACFLELKAANGRLSAEQKAMLKALEAAGCVVATAKGIDEALSVLASWGALKGMERAA